MTPNQIHCYIPTKDNNIKTFVNGLFYYGDRQYEVLSKENNKICVKEIFQAQSWRTIALKVVALASIVIPAIALCSLARNSYLYSHYYELISPVHFLPAELAQTLFSFTPPKQRHNLVQVSHNWQINAIKATKQEQHIFAKKLFEIFYSCLDKEDDKYSQIKNDCNTLFNNFTLQLNRSSTQLEIKEILIQLKFDLASIIGQVNAELNNSAELENDEPSNSESERNESLSLVDKIGNAQKPQFFEDFWALIDTYTHVHLALINHDQNHLDFAVFPLIRLKYLDRAKALVESLPPELDKNFALSALAEAFIENENLDQAIKLAKQITVHKNQVFGKLIDIFHENDDLDSVIEMIKLMDNDFVKTEKLKFVIDLLLNQDKKDQAIELIRVVPDAEILKKLVKVFVEEQDFNRVGAIAKIAQEAKLSLFETYLDEMLCGPLSKSLLHKDYDRSVEIANKMSGKFSRERAYHQIIEVILARGSVEQAIQIAKQFPETSETSDAFSLLVKVLCALKDFDQAIVYTSNIKGLFGDSRERNLIIKSLIAEGKEEQALAQASNFSKLSRGLAVYFIKNLLGRGSIDQAIEMVNGMSEGNRMVPYIFIIESLFAQGSFEKVDEILPKLIIDPESKIFLQFLIDLSKILNQQSIEDAIVFIKSLDPEIQSIGLGAISQLYAKNGKHDQSFEIIKEISDQQLRSISLYFDVLDHLIKTDNIGKIVEILQSESNSIKLAVYLMVFEKLCEMQKFEKAEAIVNIIPDEDFKLDTMIRLKVLQGKTEEAKKDYKLDLLARLLYKKGKIEEAAEVAMKISHEFDRDMKLELIVPKLAKTNLDAANNYLQKISKEVYQRVVISKASYYLGNFEVAIDKSLEIPSSLGHSSLDASKILQKIIKKNYGITNQENYFSLLTAFPISSVFGRIIELSGYGD